MGWPPKAPEYLEVEADAPAQIHVGQVFEGAEGFDVAALEYDGPVLGDLDVHSPSKSHHVPPTIAQAGISAGAVPVPCVARRTDDSDRVRASQPGPHPTEADHDLGLNPSEREVGDHVGRHVAAFHGEAHGRWKSGPGVVGVLADIVLRFEPREKVALEFDGEVGVEACAAF